MHNKMSEARLSQSIARIKKISSEVLLFRQQRISQRAIRISLLLDKVYTSISFKGIYIHLEWGGGGPAPPPPPCLPLSTHACSFVIWYFETGFLRMYACQVY